jgi:ABC-2 type transport system ATP-binding protein
MTPTVVEVRDLTKRYGDFTAVDRVSFEVGRGEIFGYLGANGAGKSTTIKMLCGLVAPTSGRASVAGADIAREPERVKRSIGYMSQRFSLYLDLTVEENLRFFAGAYGLGGARRDSRVQAALELAGLTDRRGALTSALPGGVRQRLALGSALLHEPPIVFLDEPTAGVDPEARRGFWRVIRDLAGTGTTVFVTTHHLDEAEHCARVGLMVDGKLVALDTPAGLKATHVPGALYAVELADSRKVRHELANWPGVVEVEPFGPRLHVRVQGELEDDGRLEHELRQHGHSDAAVSRVEPTLEDVFLALVGTGRSSKGAA